MIKNMQRLPLPARQEGVSSLDQNQPAHEG